MSEFDFAIWRRELEQAIRRGEDLPIRVLLDEAERGFADLQRYATDALGIWDNADPSEPTGAA